MPAVKPETEPGKYDIYPTFNIGSGKIFRGLIPLVEKIAIGKPVLLDGFCGIFFDDLRNEIDSLLKSRHNTAVKWISTLDLLRTEDEIEIMVRPFLGGDDPLFGKRTDLSLIDFFDKSKLNLLLHDELHVRHIIYGVGAALFRENGFLIYFDLPKNELQFRARAGTATNLGVALSSDPKAMYKRFYFVDWVVLGKHKQKILEKIDIIADGQRAGDITWLTGNDFRTALNDMTLNPVRTRPWFEPGSWGGTWIKDNIPGVCLSVQNYAWSFELITPENGLILESTGLIAEFSFDFLMYQEAEAVLGKAHDRFGTEFPVRFDFLDTFDGGNLSIQCHPQPGYMKDQFGENFTQEETYYILDVKDDAEVWLGFREDVDKDGFRKVLNESYSNGTPVDIEKFIQKHASHKHDLFLIPYGTIHGAGRNNLVLEISSTPYIFTFKMYDWLRPDLDGNPRPLNIDRGFDNLIFERKGRSVKDKLISRPSLIDAGPDWKLYHLPTHPSHLYDVMRYHFTTEISVATKGKFHVLSLVEGQGIGIEIEGRKRKDFNFAETFIIPAAISTYRVTNLCDRPAILIIAFIK